MAHYPCCHQSKMRTRISPTSFNNILTGQSLPNNNEIIIFNLNSSLPFHFIIQFLEYSGHVHKLVTSVIIVMWPEPSPAQASQPHPTSQPQQSIDERRCLSDKPRIQAPEKKLIITKNYRWQHFVTTIHKFDLQIGSKCF